MSEQRWPIRSWIVLLLIGLGIGAFFKFNRSPFWHRIDDEDIKLIAEGSQTSEDRFLTVYGTSRRGESFQVPATDFRDILLTLAPVETGSRRGVMRFPEYEFLYQVRMDPATIYVRKITPTTLEFEIGGNIYTGGDALQFSRRIESLIHRFRDNPPAPNPDTAPK